MARVGNIQQGYVGKLEGQCYYKGADGKTIVRKITTPKNPQTLAPTPEPGEEEAVYSQTAKINNVSQSIAGGSVSTSSLTKVELLGQNLNLATPYMTKNGEGHIQPTLEDETSQEWTIADAQVGDIYRFYNDSQLLLTVTVIEAGGNGGSTVD